MRGRRGRAAPIHMREIHKGRGAARGILSIDLALVEIDGTRIQLCARTVRYGQQGKIMSSLLHPASANVSAIRNATVVYRSP